MRLFTTVQLFQAWTRIRYHHPPFQWASGNVWFLLQQTRTQKHVTERNWMPSNVETVNYFKLSVFTLSDRCWVSLMPSNLKYPAVPFFKWTVEPYGALGYSLGTRALPYFCFLVLLQLCFLLASCPLLFSSSCFYLFLGSSFLISFPFA